MRIDFLISGFFLLNKYTFFYINTYCNVHNYINDWLLLLVFYI